MEVRIRSDQVLLLVDLVVLGPVDAELAVEVLAVLFATVV